MDGIEEKKRERICTRDHTGELPSVINIFKNPEVLKTRKKESEKERERER